MSSFTVFKGLLGFKETGKDQYQACCPAHDDKQPSLSIRIAQDGRILLHCHARCQPEKICAALGIEMKDLFADSWGRDSGTSPPVNQRQPVPKNPTKKPARQAAVEGNSAKPEIVATYDYVDETGKLLYQVVRYKPKDFRQRRPDGNGGWSWNVRGVRRILYNLPALLTAGDVFIVEGEKDVHTLEKMGLVATTSPGGAGKFTSEYTKYFNEDQHVVILPDNDDPGRKHAQQVAAVLNGHVASIRILQLSNLPPGGDVSDWAENHDPQGAGEELCRLVDGAPEYRQEETGDPGLWTGQIYTLEEAFKPRPKRQYIVTGLIPLPSLTIVYGPPGGFKTFVVADLAICVAAGLPWLAPLPHQEESEWN